jgi:non-specific serine/threonine protein kinase
LPVLHGAWLPHQEVAFWAEHGEDAELPEILAATVGPEQAQRLGLLDRFGRPAAKVTPLTLWLPGLPSGRLPSDQLVGPDPPRRGRRQQRPYTISAVVLEMPEAYALLRALSAEPTDSAGSAGSAGSPDSADVASYSADVASYITLGASTRWLSAVASFAADLVHRGRVLPGLIPESDGGQAVWSPVLSGPDLAWTQALAAAAPPSVAAARPYPATDDTTADRPDDRPDDRARPGTPRTLDGTLAVTAAALDALVDTAARHALGVWPFGYRKRSRDTPLLNAWLAGLGSRHNHVDAPAEQIAQFATAIEEWQQDAATGSVRLCLRLVEPGGEALADSSSALLAGDAGDDVWSLQFLLQPADEPSLVVEAAALWTSSGAARALARHIPEPQEALLAELGRASRLYPAIARALREQQPREVLLDTESAHRFLRDGAPALAAAGFGILLPSWWLQRPVRLGWHLAAQDHTQPGAAATAAPVENPLDKKRMLDFQWELALGSAPLSRTELEQLARAKANLVRLRGHWVEVDAERLAAAIALVDSGTSTTLADIQGDVADLLRLASGLRQAPAGLPVTAVTANGWIRELLAGEGAAGVVESPVSDRFFGQLRPYQHRGLSWLRFLDNVGLGGVLADDMGLGKTVQVLALLADDEPGRRTLLVCPMSIVGNWQREAARFVPSLRVHVHHGGDRVRGTDFPAAVADADLVITTYALAALDADVLGQVTWDRIVLDEAQTVKNSATRQSAAVRTLPAQRRLALTGTPVENRLADLWSVLDITNPGIAGTATEFAHRYAIPIEKYDDRPALERLQRITTPLVLRRLKTDRSVIADLPDKIEMDLLCNLTHEQASLYQATVDHLRYRLDRVRGQSRRGLVLSTLTRLKQICDHPALATGDGGHFSGRSGKVERLEGMLDEILAGHDRALIFTQYATFGGMLTAHVSRRFGREVLFLHGGLTQPARDELVERFQEADRHSPPLLIASLKAGGTGLNLTAANQVIHMDRWWNPAVEDQATDRAFRIGQQRTVQVRKLVCVGTVEERVADLIRQKRRLTGATLGSGDGWLADLSTDQLVDVLRLGTEAVSE